MITYFSFEPQKQTYTDFKGRLVIPGEAVFSTDKVSVLRTRSAYVVLTSQGWVLMNQNDYGADPNSLIQNELNSICPQAIAA